jgi:hypothetical protein
MINALTFSQDTSWSLSHPSGSTTVAIHAWGAGGHGGSVGNGGAGGGYSELITTLGNGIYPIVVGQPTNTDGGLSSFTSESVIIVQAPGGKSDGSITGQTALLTGSVTASGGPGAANYTGYSTYNGSGGGSAGGPFGNGTTGQSAFYSTRTSGATGGLVPNGVGGNGGNGGNGAYFDAGTHGVIIAAQAGENPGGGGGGAYDYGTNDAGQGGAGRVEILLDTGLSYFAAPVVDFIDIPQDGNYYSRTIDVSPFTGNSLCYVTISADWSQSGFYSGTLGALSTDLYQFQVSQGNNILFVSPAIGNGDYAPDTTLPATQSFVFKNLSAPFIKGASLFLQASGFEGSDHTFRWDDITISLYASSSVDPSTHMPYRDVPPTFVLPITASGPTDETNSINIPLDVSQVPPGEYTYITLTALESPLSVQSYPCLKVRMINGLLAKLIIILCQLLLRGRYLQHTLLDRWIFRLHMSLIAIMEIIIIGVIHLMIGLQNRLHFSYRMCP